VKFQTPEHIASDIHSTYANKIPKLELESFRRKRYAERRTGTWLQTCEIGIQVNPMSLH